MKYDFYGWFFFNRTLGYISDVNKAFEILRNRIIWKYFTL